LASGGGTKKSSKDRPRRVRYGNLPKPAETNPVPYALDAEGLKGKSCGERTEIVIRSKAFKEEIGRICEKLDAKRQKPKRGAKKPGPKYSYSSLELELVFVYQWVCGFRSVKEARDRLAGDRGADARRIFGLDVPRDSMPWRKRVLRDGIPSDASLSRHRQRFGERRRRGAYERLARRRVIEHLVESPEMGEEARIIGIDGSTQLTHYTCPIIGEFELDTGEKFKAVSNWKQVTDWEGAYVGKDAGPEKSGHGRNILFMTTLTGLPMVNLVTALDASEKTGLRPGEHPDESQGERHPLLRKYERDVMPYQDQDKVGVALADGGFHSHPLRRDLHELGLIEVLHKVSHAEKESSQENAKKHDRMRFEIEGYPNWYANGHEELFCKCGKGHTWKDVGKRNGQAVIRNSGDCEKCGRISITAGTYRKAKKPKDPSVSGRYVRCQPGEYDQANQAFGNPLTYHDKLARRYGTKRYGNCEGFHGALVSRFPVLKGKRWIRRDDQTMTELAMITVITHSLAMEHRRCKAAREAQERATGPPALAKAA
jgi:hypothetical protein